MSNRSNKGEKESKCVGEDRITIANAEKIEASCIHVSIEGETPEIVVSEAVKCLEKFLGAATICEYTSTINYLVTTNNIPFGIVREFGIHCGLIDDASTLVVGSKQWKKIRAALASTVKALKKSKDLFAHLISHHKVGDLVGDSSKAFVEPRFAERAVAVLKLLDFVKEKTGTNPILARDYKGWQVLERRFESCDADALFA
eukprot:TRINITY_DN774405_c0_g1_i1.p1 TRINITY_DN774405_c0_g1~~TRINITY_DN774405_c0_g1_i1.p1  ORF type:complete len:201 (+),score=47.98 TRINITY_DN774405_c0_g1_i1:138-740(+)